MSSLNEGPERGWMSLYRTVSTVRLFFRYNSGRALSCPIKQLERIQLFFVVIFLSAVKRILFRCNRGNLTANQGRQHGYEVKEPSTISFIKIMSERASADIYRTYNFPNVRSVASSVRR
jgi:hypothetical protein